MPPTGVALTDVRRRLFDAAERILLRGGTEALTSRAVTVEADVAKGVVHKHFDDFDDFLVQLVEDRITRVEATDLRPRAGTGTVPDNLAEALTDLFSTVALAVVGLIIARDEVRRRLRRGRTGMPLLGAAATMLTAYLDAERDAGRLRPDADTATLALTLIGTSHLVFSGRDGLPPDPAEVLRFVTATVVPALA